jgi:hypothetical protein
MAAATTMPYQETGLPSNGTPRRVPPLSPVSPLLGSGLGPFWSSHAPPKAPQRIRQSVDASSGLMRSSAVITGPDPRSVVRSFRLVGLPGWNWHLRPWRRTASRHEQDNLDTKPSSRCCRAHRARPCPSACYLSVGRIPRVIPPSPARRSGRWLMKEVVSSPMQRAAACDLESSTCRVESSRAVTAVPPALFQCGQKPLYRYKMELPTYSAEVSWPILHWHLDRPRMRRQLKQATPKRDRPLLQRHGDESHNVWLRRTEFQAFLRATRESASLRHLHPREGGLGAEASWRGTNAYATPAKYGGIVVPEARLESRPRHRNLGARGGSDG